MIKVSQACTGKMEVDAACRVLEIGYFGHTSIVDEFELKLAQFLEVQPAQVVAVSNGTAAIQIAAELLGSPGIPVAVPSFTFIGTWMALATAGCGIVPIDINESLCIDEELLQTSDTECVVPVDYAGQYAKVPLGHVVIRDAAHSFGSLGHIDKYKFDDATCFSFDSIKNITCGEGGAVVFRDLGLAQTARELRNLGRAPYRRSPVRVGYRYHMSSINAAIGLAQLEKLPFFRQKRRMLCEAYDKRLSDIDQVSTLDIDYSDTMAHIYVIQVDPSNQDALRLYLRNEGIETELHYIPCHLNEAFFYGSGALPETIHASRSVVTLPLHCNMTLEDVSKITNRIKNFFS